MPTLPPLFEHHADATLERVRATYAQRGKEYADTWRDAQFLAMQATAKQLGLKLDTDQCRKLAAAAFVDMKYSRLSGGYKDDSVVDGIAYQALWCELMGDKPVAA